MLLSIALLLCLLHHSVLGNPQYHQQYSHSSDYFYSPYSSAYPSSSSSYPNYLYHHRPYGGYGTSSSSSYYRPGANGYGSGNVYPGGGGYGNSLPLTSGYGPNSGYGTAGSYGGGGFPPIRYVLFCKS